MVADAVRGRAVYEPAQVVQIQMAIATGPDEFAHRQIGLLGDQMGQQGIAGDVEQDPRNRSALRW